MTTQKPARQKPKGSEDRVQITFRCDDELKAYFVRMSAMTGLGEAELVRTMIYAARGIEASSGFGAVMDHRIEFFKSHEGKAKKG